MTQIPPELLSIHATNAFVDTVSSARGIMYSSHLSQTPVIAGSCEKRIQTGVERELGRSTFSIKMPANGTILRVIERYPKSVGIDSIPYNPETLVIYEDDDTKEIGCFSIPYYRSLHQYFGFRYDIKPAVNKLMPANKIEKGVVFADSPSVKENGGYAFGIELNMAFMSHPAVSEDGILIAEDVLDKLKFNVYETREIEFGSRTVPLNLYGSKDVYKPFPEIGEYIGDHGILVMLREYDNDLAPVEMSIYDLQEPDHIMDTPVYVRGPGGRVVDIKIYHDDDIIDPTPVGVMSYMNKYTRALKRYYGDIIKTYNEIKADRKKKYGDGRVVLKPELHRLLVEAMVVLSDQSDPSVINKRTQKKGPRLAKLYRKSPLDAYRVEIVLEYELRPTVGYKLTDSHGGKGVVVVTVPRDHMPVDKEGNVADIVMDSGSTFHRMNIGRLYEQYIGAASVKVENTVKSYLGIPSSKDKRAVKNRLLEIQRDDPNRITQCIRHVLGFYKEVSNRQYEFYSKLSIDQHIDNLVTIITDKAYVYYPIDNDMEHIDIVKRLESNSAYRPIRDCVSYIGYSGRRVTTKYPVRIGPLYMLLLDKIADTWSSVSSAKLQHFGVLSPRTKSEKYNYPFRNTPIRTIGETEGRIYMSYCGREAIAEMMDRSNNPMTHKEVYETILNADKPTDIDVAVDRNKTPLGNIKPLQLVDHISYCGGWKIVYEPEDK